MELFEQVELAMWKLRRTIERARYIQLETTRLEEETRRRIDAMRQMRSASASGRLAPSDPETPG